MATVTVAKIEERNIHGYRGFTHLIFGWLANLGAVLLGVSGIADRQKAAQTRDRLFIMGSLCFIMYSLPNGLYISVACQTTQVWYFYKRYREQYGSFW